MPLRLRPRSAAPIALGVMVAKVATSLPRLAEPSTQVLVVITWGTVAAFLGVGLVLFRTAVPRANAWACILVAAATIPGDLAEPYFVPYGLTPVGYVLEYSYLVAGVALTLRYPHPALERRDRFALALIAVGAIGLRLPQVFTVGPARDNFHAPAGWPALGWPVAHDVLVRAGILVTVAGLAWTAIRLAQKAFTARGVARQSQAPVTAAGTVVAVFSAADRLTWLSAQALSWAWVPQVARDLGSVAIPIALIGDLLRRRAAGAAVSLQVVSAAQSGALPQLRSALADALADPGVEVWLAATDGDWVRSDGVHGPLPDAHTDPRVEIVLDTAGQPLCAIGVDPRVVRDEELFQSAVRAARLGMENDRLRGQLLLRMAEVEESRERIVEAGAAERRRVERDLHDGAQQQLLAVAASLAKAGLVEDPDQVRSAVSGARAQLADALAELRRLARGIHPAALSQGGLEAALPGLGETAVLPTRVLLGDGVRGRRFKTSVESTTYFVVAEALTNVARHAHASHAEVTVDLRDAGHLPGPPAGPGPAVGPRLVISVVDDGRGGAVMRPDGGLAGLLDRIQALGGTLEVTAGPDRRGTAILVELPVGAQEPT